MGYAEAADVGITSFDGKAVASAVLVKYTYYGDSSLDGKVDLGNDFNLFVQGFLNNGNSWELGDYNYDGVVDVNDFQLFVNGFAAQGGQLGDLENAVAIAPGLSGAQRSAMLAVVPEPTCFFVILPLSASALLRRRRTAR